MAPTLYECPVHRAPLVRSGDIARCGACAEPYSIKDEIWILDPVQRSDRTAFDEQVETNPIPLDLAKAERYLAQCGVESFEGAAVLDIGCGLGDLTYGMAASGRLRNCSIYAFDHSFSSVRSAAAVVRPERGNRVYFSTQDASHLFFPDASFDLVIGSAVLHHILDYEALLAETLRMLRPGGRAVFSEPFLEGYFWVCFLLQCAVRDLGLKKLDRPEYGLCQAILENTGARTRNAGNLAYLDGLTDKHYFTVEGVLKVAQRLGYREVSFANYADASFYDGWMAHFLDIYGITDKRLRERAIQLYTALREYSGPALPALVPHFQYIVLKK